MQERDSKGRFLPFPVAVGDYAYNHFKGFNPGFTPGRAYEVIRTYRCKDRSSVQAGVERELRTQWEFIVLDDQGMERRGDLRAMMGNFQTPAHKLFPKWEVLKRQKVHKGISTSNIARKAGR